MALMDILNAVILGIVEGLTEFLPISSTGHLILFEQFFGFTDKDFSSTFMVTIQSGAILAVIIFFWRRFWPFGLKDKPETAKKIKALWARTIVASIPAIVLALLFQKTIKGLLFHPLPVAIALIVWGIVIIVLEARNKKRTLGGYVPPMDSPEGMNWKTVVLVGLFQCLALVPGTSRSAATIVGAMLLGVSRVAAAEFSFFLAIPVLLGAGAYELIKADLSFTMVQWNLILVGVITSFAIAYAVIALFMGFIRKSSFAVFGWYRIVLGSVVIAALALGLFPAA